MVCHNDALLTGNLSLQHFAVENAAAEAETSEKMIRKLRAGMMPPPGFPRQSFINLIDGPYEDRFSPTEWSHAGMSRRCGP